ncbi:MAG TPA: MarR family transcriptional regulator [Solirubrobacteraceae bacterium]|nr:MarR family transcriptional regulator [Solirubrobacteraceae bacterium]
MSTSAGQTAGSDAPPLDAAARLGQSLKAAMVAVRRLRGRESHQPGRLSYAQYSLLFSLASEPEMPANRLAALADLTPGTVTPMLDHLEADGLVTRTRSPHDKRVVLISLTESGQQVVAERHARFAPRWTAALEGFSDAELLTAAAVLDRVRAMFDAIDEDDPLTPSP